MTVAGTLMRATYPGTEVGKVSKACVAVCITFAFRSRVTALNH
jgi:hypothetical protein